MGAGKIRCLSQVFLSPLIVISCTIFKGLWSPWKTLQVSGTINDDRGTELTIVEANPKYVIPCISLE